MQFILPILSLFLLSSCSLLLGIREPTALTQAKVRKAAEKLNLQNYHLYSLDSAALEKLSDLPYKPGWPEGFRPLQYKVFDPDGKLIAQYSTCEGSYKNFPGLFNFPPENNINPHNPEWALENEMEYLIPLDTASSTAKNDLTFVVYWATWLGRPGKRMVSRVKDYSERHSNKRIRIILVNLLEWPGD